MIQFYPSFDNLMKKFLSIGASQTGIVQSFISPACDIHGEPFAKAFTVKMPNYHKVVLDDPKKDMQYHLSGYGSFYEEAFIKIMGESIERYAILVSSKMFEDKIEYLSYNQMICKYNRVMPLEYIGIFSASQQKRMSQLMPAYSSTKPTPDDIIGWISCPSLVYPGENVWVPAQMFFVGFKKNDAYNEKLYIPSFSTGTATHITLKNALLNALIEYIQIDAFVINWYTMRKSPRVIIDDHTSNVILEQIGLGENSKYEKIVLYYTLEELPLPTFGVFLRRKDGKIPYISFGTQGDTSPANAVVRGIFEANGIVSYNYFQAIYDPDMYFTSVYESCYTDLDTNVVYFSSTAQKKEKDQLIKGFIEKEIHLSYIPSMKKASIDEDISELLRAIKKISDYAVYLDITPPEAEERGFKVVRVLIPELLGMCLPGMPFIEHPRLKQYGGVKNEFPHPLP